MQQRWGKDALSTPHCTNAGGGGGEERNQILDQMWLFNVVETFPQCM